MAAQNRLMNPIPTMASEQDPRGLSPRLREHLATREQELRALLHDAAEARVNEHSTDVQDFKDFAADESRAVIDDVALSHAAAELTQVSAALRRLADGG